MLYSTAMAGKISVTILLVACAGYAAEPACEPVWIPMGPAPVISEVEGEGADTLRLLSGRAYAVAGHPKDPNIIYLGAAGGGVWKTVDGGEHWRPLTDDLPSLAIKALALAPHHPEMIFAGTGEVNPGTARGILKSTDGGHTWTHMGGHVFYRHSIQKVVVDPNDPDTIYVAVGEFPPITAGLQDNNRGIWKSQDGGTTWSNTTPRELRSRNFSDVVVDFTDPKTLYAAIGEVSGSPENGVYKTTDGGATWSLVLAQPDEEPGAIFLAMSRSVPDIVYAAIAASPPSEIPFIIKKTTDGGQSWTRLDGFSVRGGAYTTTLAVDPTTPDIVYATSFKDGRDIVGAIMSTDGGRTWDQIGVGINGPEGDHRGVAFDAHHRLLDANDGGASRFDASSRSWTLLNGNLAITQLWDIAVHPVNPEVAFGAGPDSGYMKSLPGSGGRWYKMDRGDGSSILVDSAAPSTLYAQGLGVSLRRSDDRGRTWEPKFEGIDRGEGARGFVPVVMDPVNTSRLLLATTFVYETADRAENWNQLGGFGEKIDRLGITPADPQTIYAAARGRVHVSFDRGKSWTATRPPGLGDSDTIGGLWVHPRDALKAYAVSNSLAPQGARHGHVFRTTDGGDNWTDISGSLPDLAVLTIAVDPRGDSDILYIGTTNGVFSYHAGGVWSRFGKGLPNAVVEKLVLNAHHNILGAGANGRGMFEICIAR